MKTSIIGFPRVGKQRELKFETEKYFRKEVREDSLLEVAAELRKGNWNAQKQAGISFIPSNDFSHYDNILDMAMLLNIVPKRYRELNLPLLDTYFAMARGYQGEQGDVRALAMKKWFNTNYHYIVPEFEDDMDIRLNGSKPFDEYTEAKSLGVQTKPVFMGAYTFLKLLRFTGTKTAEDIVDSIANAYGEVLKKLDSLGAEWIQFDEPSLVMDMTGDDIALYVKLYNKILKAKGNCKVLLQTYFGDIRDCYQKTIQLDFDGIGLDFLEGRKSMELVEKFGFPENKTLFAGLINGKNIWKNNYSNTLSNVFRIQKAVKNVVLGTSCSLLHVPYTLENESDLEQSIKDWLAFAQEKLDELFDLQGILSTESPLGHQKYVENKDWFSKKRAAGNSEVKQRVEQLQDSDFTRLPLFKDRETIQREKWNFPLLPTTTIGSFPQTSEVRANRLAYRKGKISKEEYDAFNRNKIKECVTWQDKIGLDILVHGEFERNDMVEYFGENLDGFLFTQRAWVQSYGTRCVKPPIIWDDISRRHKITVDHSVFAQSCTEKPMKGMLTGPVTILNWSFPREDITIRESTLQIALAIREEALDLENNGIQIIQIDEAALREKLPLRKTDWHSEYLDWAIPAFRLVHSGMKPETQIHTHMCYSEFTDIIADIDAMDADVISFEASRSDLQIIDALNKAGFRTQVGPGVYDIHSPRVPSVQEIKKSLVAILEKIPAEKLWVNPDCGLKTRREAEVVPSLENMVTAAKELREKFIR